MASVTRQGGQCDKRGSNYKKEVAAWERVQCVRGVTGLAIREYATTGDDDDDDDDDDGFFCFTHSIFVIVTEKQLQAERDREGQRTGLLVRSTVWQLV